MEVRIMTVITISSELGSGGQDIAQHVAKALGYEFVDKRTTDEILRQYGLTKFPDLYSSAPSLLDLLNADNLLLVSMSNEIMEALAKRGNIVILGRTGFVVLGGRADVLHVHIHTPLAERVQRVMDREGLADAQAAEEQVREDDNVHRTYLQRFYNKEWADPANFNLILDTGTVSTDQASQQIIAAAQALQQKALGAKDPTTATIEVDPVLADAVAKVMA
jgi:cytidylate kinase